MQRAAIHVDIIPVRLIADDLHRGAQVAEYPRGDRIGGSVSAVQKYFMAFKAEAGRQRALEKLLVIPGEIFFMQPGVGGRERKRLFAKEQLFHLLFYSFAQLEPVAGEEFYPVEFGRIVAGGDDYAEIGVLALDQVGNRGRGYYAEVHHFELAGPEALHQVFLYKPAGGARIHAQQHDRLARAGFFIFREHERGRIAYFAYKIGGERIIPGDAAYAVSSKKFAHFR